MHGDMAQKVRMDTLDKFKSNEVNLLVCSDVAARGIDINNVSHVFNYDVPMNPDDYVHRIGRTGRAGAKGRAWMLVTSYDEKYLDSVVKRIGKDIEEVKVDVEREKERSSSDKAPEKKKSPHKKNNQSKKPRHQNDDVADVCGFGDDVPAFFKM